MLPFGTPHGFLPTSVPSFGVSNAQHFPQQHLMPLHNPQMATIIPRPSDVQTIPIPIPGSTTMSEWSEHKTPEGKIYYYNRVKKISLWSKPDELKTADEIERSAWKDYKTAEGKPYYYNIKTKVTTWTKPEILLKLDNGITKSPQPELVHVSSKTELERAMQATLKKYNPDEKAVDPADGDFEKIFGGGSSPKQSTEKTAEDIEHDIKKRQVEKFQELLRDKCVDRKISVSMSWEQAMKYLQHDPRFKILGKMSERKQVFNAWKIQRSKEERDEKRLAIKKSKEDLEHWLLGNEKVKPTLAYRKADAMFSSEQLWRAVSDSERREIFQDVLKAVTKRDEENKKTLRERNIKLFSDLLDAIPEIDYKTTWATAQQYIANNAEFSKDSILQGMDKEDALMIFQQHIRAAEEQYQKDKAAESKRNKRQERKIREQFMQFLQELYVRGLLTPFSSWSSLFPIISADERFDNMLSQTGSTSSTSLDMFKFYTEDLKIQYSDNKKLVKNILKDQNVKISCNTSFDEFQKLIRSDNRGKNIDIANLKLSYNNLVDKVIEKEKDTAKETSKKKKRIESEFWDLLRSIQPPVDPATRWDSIKNLICEEISFTAFDSEEDRVRCFDNYVDSLAEACGHHHSKLKKKKEKKKKSKREEADPDDEPRSHKRKKFSESRDLKSDNLMEFDE